MRQSSKLKIQSSKVQDELNEQASVADRPALSLWPITLGDGFIFEL